MEKFFDEVLDVTENFGTDQVAEQVQRKRRKRGIFANVEICIHNFTIFYDVAKNFQTSL